jgi:hypothetical protein
MEAFMQSIQSMFRRSSHHVARQRALFALRARKAGTSFTAETKHASLDFASAIRSEAGAWTKFVRESAQAATHAIAPVALERTVLARFDVVLRAIDERVRRRIDALHGHTSPNRARTKAKRNGVINRRESSASRARARAS